MLSRMASVLRLGVLRNHHRLHSAPPAHTDALRGRPTLFGRRLFGTSPLTPSQEQDQGRMLIGFTCKVCEARSHRTMSRHAYTKGIVLVECPGCSSRHLIADNLGWFEQRGEARTVEEILAARGESVRRVWRQDEHGAILECLGEERPPLDAESKRAPPTNAVHERDPTPKDTLAHKDS